MKSFVIGAEQSEQITVTVMSYECPPSGDYNDDNWLSCQVQIRAGAFRGKYSANFVTSELAGLLQGLESLYRDLKGTVAFESLEGQLELNFTCDNLGHIHINCTAMDQAGIGHVLQLSISSDQTYLGKTLVALREVVKAFPVRT